MEKNIRKILQKKSTQEFMRYFVTGLLGLLVDTIVLLLVTVLVFKGNDEKVLGLIYASKLVSSFFGFTFVFFLNRHWSFKATHGKLHKQGLRMAVVFVANIFVGAAIYTIYFDLLSTLAILPANELNATASNILTSATQMLLNFFLYKYIVFAAAKETA